MGQLTFTTAEVEKLLDGRYNNFRQIVSHSVSVAVDNTDEFVLPINGLGTFASVVSPDYITSRWDGTNYKFAIPEELDSPNYSAVVSFIFDPDVAAVGEGTLRAYIIGDTVPTPATDNIIYADGFDYKAAPEYVTRNISFFLGSDTGYDAKNKGVYFTIQLDKTGDLTQIYADIHRT